MAASSHTVHTRLGWRTFIIPRFGAMERRANREKILATWLRSKGFRRTGPGAGQLSGQILNECRNVGDFIRVVMDAVVGSQQAPRQTLHFPPAFHGFQHGDFVGVFDVAVYRNAHSDPG